MLGKLFSSKSGSPSTDAPKDAPAQTEKPAASNPSGDLGALNQAIVQAVSFSNQQTQAALPDFVSIPANTLAAQSAGHALQSAVAYMNGVMQVSLAGQAVIAKRDLENPANAAADAPVLAALQAMVTAAVTSYGAVSTTAGTSVQTMLSDTQNA